MGMKFNTAEQAIEYGKEKYMGKYDFETVEVMNETVILCGTCIPYEDEFYPFAENILDKFGLQDDIETSELRDAFIEAFEKICNVTFLDVFDEF